MAQDFLYIPSETIFTIHDHAISSFHVTHISFCIITWLMTWYINLVKKSCNARIVGGTVTVQCSMFQCVISSGSVWCVHWTVCNSHSKVWRMYSICFSHNPGIMSFTLDSCPVCAGIVHPLLSLVLMYSYMHYIQCENIIHLTRLILTFCFLVMTRARIHMYI